MKKYILLGSHDVINLYRKNVTLLVDSYNSDFELLVIDDQSDILRVLGNVVKWNCFIEISHDEYNLLLKTLRATKKYESNLIIQMKLSINEYVSNLNVIKSKFTYH